MLPCMCAFLTYVIDPEADIFIGLFLSLLHVVCLQLYAQAFGSIIGFKFLSDMILLSIVSKVNLLSLSSL